MDPETFADEYRVSRETLTRLLAYQALLGRWQQRINLVGPATLEDFWSRHAADSAQLLALAEDRRVWLDLGSGGGFPGLVVAIMLAETGGHVHLVESDGRKAAFLRTVIREVGAPASVHNRRAEELATAEEFFWQMWGPLVRVPWRPCRNYWSWWRRFSIHPQLPCSIRALAGKMN